MHAAILAAWAAAVLLAGLHVLEHRSAASAHAAAWRALPRGVRAGIMCLVFSAAIVTACAYWVVPAVTLAMLALADVAGAFHLLRHWRHPS